LGEKLRFALHRFHLLPKRCRCVIVDKSHFEEEVKVLAFSAIATLKFHDFNLPQVPNLMLDMLPSKSISQA